MRYPLMVLRPCSARTMPTAKRQAREGGAVSLVYRISEVEDRIDQQREAMAKAGIKTQK